jgi:YD repeat-containing protein
VAVGIGGPPLLRYSYDDQGRILSGPSTRYVHGKNGAARSGDRAGHVVFNARGRLVSDGSTHHTYDALGRLVRVDFGGSRFLAYKYAADGTYTTDHNDPDSDEFCEASLTEVRRDARGLIVLDRFEGCLINEFSHTLRYSHDERDRIQRIDIDLDSDGTVELIVKLRFSC